MKTVLAVSVLVHEEGYPCRGLVIGQRNRRWSSEKNRDGASPLHPGLRKFALGRAARIYLIAVEPKGSYYHSIYLPMHGLPCTTLAPHWYCVAYTRTSPEDSGAANTSLQSGGKWYFKQPLSKGLRNRSAPWEFPWSICILVSMAPRLCLDPHSLWTHCSLAILVYWAVPCTSSSKHLGIRWISVMGDKKYTMTKTKQQQQQQRKRGPWNMYILGFSAWRSSWSVIGFGGSTLSNLYIPKSPKPSHWPVLPKVLHVSTS